MKEGNNILLPILRWKLLGVTLYTCALCIPLILFSLGISDPYPLIFVLLLLGLRSTLINYVLITRMYSNLKDKLLIALFDSLTVLQIFLAIKDMYVVLLCFRKLDLMLLTGIAMKRTNASKVDI